MKIIGSVESKGDGKTYPVVKFTSTEKSVLVLVPARSGKALPGSSRLTPMYRDVNDFYPMNPIDCDDEEG